MRNFYILAAFLVSLQAFSQDVSMQNGTFNRCAPDKLYDSGGSTANYSSNENYVTTICAINPADFIILNFTAFSTQLGQDVLTIYDGPDTSAPLIGNYSGGLSGSPGTVSASPANTSGCLTLKFVSNASGNGSGFVADILCAEPCQTITASIDSTTPPPNGSGVITIFPGGSVDFNGSATFSGDGTGATYSWNFADSSPVVSGLAVSHIFNNPGTYNVTFTASDTNPQGCSNSVTISVLVLQAIVSINNSAYPESLYTPEELIENVLVSGGCSAVDNFSVQVNGTPSNFQGKNYGYFNKGGAVNFPFEEGIILSTGRAAAGGNVINGNLVSFNNNQPGDADLEAALGQNDTNDAAYIKFNFVPTDNVISFRYLMASEEYDGNTECSFADSFAFLLREVGTLAYTNLAVLPNGTPVSVTNINNSGNCTANPTYFAGYDDDFPTPINDTNYGGRTIALTATANVILGATYEIKLVVADEGDSIWDSAIFIEAGSFNLGGELGDDITIVAGTAECNGDAITLDTQAPNATHVWYQDGVVIPGETSSILSVVEAGIYSVDVIFTASCQSNDSILVEFFPSIAIDSTQDLFICNPGSAPYIFDLTENNPNIFGSITDTSNYIITYHQTLAEAETDMNAIADPTSYSGTDGQTIFARLEYLSSGCYDSAPFTLNIISQPLISSVSDLQACEDTAGGNVTQFDLDSQTLGILGPQPSTDFTVTYYASFGEADTGTGALASPYTNISNPQPIYVRIERVGDPDCNNVSPLPLFDLVVDPSDDAAFTVTPTCDGATATVSGTGGGIFTFNPVPTDGAAIDPSTGTVSSASSGGSYTVEYTTGGTCPVTGSQSFTVPVVDDAGFTVSPTCDGATATITGTSGGTFALDPVPGDGTVIDPATGTVTNGTPGTSYTIGYTTTGTCPSSSSQNFTVIPVDDASFTLTPTCDGATATITGSIGGTFAFNPAPTDAAVINTASGTITGGTSASTYTVEYTTSGTCTAVSAQNVTVLTTDDASFTMTPTCDGGTATLNGTTGGVFSFNPVPTDGAIVDGASGTVTGGTPGAAYTIVYTTSGICPSSSAQVLNVLPVDNSSFTMAPTCDGAIATITGVAGGTFNFNPVPSDGAVVNTSSGLVTGATPGVSYTIEYTTNGICPSTSTVTFNVNSLPTIFAPGSLVVCDDNVPDGLTQIDLAVKDAEITGGNPLYAVTYHLTPGEADSGTAPLPTPYTNVSNPQTVHVRVVDTATGCYDTTTLLLQVEQAPVANVPDALEYCDPNNDGFGEFDLTDAEAQVTGGASGLQVSYHETLANAGNNVNALPTDYENIVAYSQTVYVRVVSSVLATDCATIVPLVLNVLPTPVVPLDIADYVICDTDPDGRVQFDLTTKNGEILGGQDPSQYALTYHLSQADADGGTGAIVNVGNYTNTSNPQTIYVRLEGSNGCYKTGEFELRVDLPPVTFQPTELSLCDDGVADEMTSFNLTVKDVEITGGDGSLSVAYYTTDAGAQAGTGAIDPATAYVNMSVNGNAANPQTLYVRVTDTATGCTSFRTLTIRVLPNPTPRTDPSDLVLCDDVNTGDGVEEFDLTANQAYILDGAPGISATYYAALGDAQSGTDAIADPVNYTNTTADFTPFTIYVRVEDDLTGCYAIVDFDILVNPLPAAVAVTDYILCEVETDGFAQFDLRSKDGEVLGGQDPSLYSVSYHATPGDAQNLTGALNSPYTNTVNPQEIFVAITDNGTGCSIGTVSFFLEVDNGAQANSDLEPIEHVECDYLGDNDGVAQFDLTENSAEVLDGQDAANFTATYYETQVDAELGSDPIPDIYENTSNPQVIYVRVDNDTPDAAGMDSSICYAVAQLTLRVDLRPVFDLGDSYTLCVETNGTEVIGPPVLDTGLPATDYTFEWALDGTVLSDQTGPSLAAAQGGSYTVTVTNATTGCTESDSAEVSISSPPALEVGVGTQAFSENGVIIASATGEGEYEYSLDGGAWQASGTFEGVPYGEHTVRARDINGCGTASGSVTVLDYPHFFTPNGDGRNETWNIVGFGGQPSAKIHIFDRFGKLLKQISPSGQGWNGTYNGEPMPTSDYWFTVEYTEPSTGEPKQFKAHFTLKR